MNDPLIDALQADAGENGPGKTTEELCAVSGRGTNFVRRRLRVLQAEGRLRVHHPKRMSLNGHMQLHTTYELIQDDGLDR